MNLNQLNIVHPLKFTRKTSSSVLNQIAERVISGTQTKRQENFMAVSKKSSGNR